MLENKREVISNSVAGETPVTGSIWHARLLYATVAHSRVPPGLACPE
jgi:hypothetical protein